jgi:hypothetical protein
MNEQQEQVSEEQVSVPFQSSAQFVALQVHDKLIRAAEFLWTPFRLVWEEFDGTAALRQFNAAPGLPDIG